MKRRASSKGPGLGTRRLYVGVIVAVGIIIGALTLFLTRSAAKPAAGAANAQTGAPPVVAVVRVVRADLSETLSLSAEFRPFQEVNLYAKVSGYVHEMKVDIGARVKAGDVLAILEIPELQDEQRRAMAGLERARQEEIRGKAAYDDVHRTFSRLSEVLQQQPNLIAQQEIDEARGRDETHKASWDAAQSAVREAIANKAKYDTMLAYSRIIAPFPGVVTKRYADTGSLVGAGTSSSSQALVRVSQLDPLRLVLPVPASAVSKLREGSVVDVHIQATGQTISAKISRASGEIATNTRTMQVEVDVANPQLRLAPGMYATADIVQDTRQHVLALPIEAVPDRKDGTGVVYVLNAQQRIEERHVVLGLETSAQIEVKSGIDEGELVLTGGRGRYQPGQAATPKVMSEARGQQ